MKTKKIILFAMLALFITGACAQTIKTKEIDIKVTFHCANGKALIEKEMMKVDGVSSVVADLETKIVTIVYDEKKQNKETLVAAIEKIGYITEFTKEGTDIKKACTHEQPKSE